MTILMIYGFKYSKAVIIKTMSPVIIVNDISSVSLGGLI